MEIFDDDNVLRRVPTMWPNYIKPDGTISSYAFTPRKNDKGLSVDLERLSSYKQATLGRHEFRLLKLGVDNIRNQVNDGLDVIHDPIQDNIAHSLIIGNITKGKQKLLLKHSTELTR